MSLAAEIAQRHKRFHAEIARKAAVVKQREAIVLELPKAIPGRQKKLQHVEFPTEYFWTNMWFYDLVFQSEKRPLTIALIQEVICDHFKVRLSDLVSSRRTADIVLPRQIGYYLSKKLTPRSYPEIGRRFGGRDHTSILWGAKQIAARMERDSELAAQVKILEAHLQ
jgi:hypothetical protein